MDMASKCRKFVPNIFNKTKCQTCFGSKEQHSAEALENNKASRKMSKCGYLFVAPGYDFNNPLDKTRRWQRRFFILYDDGELAYSVDENPDTVPQGVVDMNKCTDVKDATGSTGHQNSMAVITPEKTTYIKGNSKEEIQWWHNILSAFPANNESVTVTRPKFFIDISNKENINISNLPDKHKDPKSQTPSGTDKEETTDSSRVEVEKAKPKDQPFSTYRGVRSMKHTKADKHYQEGLRKSSSLHDLTTDGKDSSNLDQSRFLSRSGENLDKKDNADLRFTDSARLLSGYSSNPYSGIPRSQSWKSPGKPLQKNGIDSSSNSSVSTQASNSDMASLARRGSFDDNKTTGAKPRGSERSHMHRERSASMKAFPTSLTLPKIPSSVNSGSVDRLLPRAEGGSTSRQGEDGHHINENETDEHKMAKSSELQTASRPTATPPSPSRTVGPATKYEQPAEPLNRVKLTPDREQDLMYMKKGWLIKMGTSEKDWKKHWFVLTGNSLRYYKDAKAEEGNQLDGRIDLSSCYEISEIQIQRNYGFKIKTRNGEYILSAMTSGIRSNWMKAIRLCMDLQSSTKNNQSKPSTSSTSTANQRTNDDMQIDSSSKSSDSSRAKEKKEFTRNVRRHYSDVNPGNISKMFSIKGITLDNSKSLSQSLSSNSNSSASSAPSSKEPSIERETQSEQMSPPMADLGAAGGAKASKYDPYWSADGTPLGRYVEGSDSDMNDTTASSRAETTDKDEEERRRRAKSPSAKIKERTRAKSPKLHSPPPGHEQDKFSFRPTAGKEVEKGSLSSEDMEFIDAVDHDDVAMDNEDNMASTLPSAGEGMLVDLLENEVESLKERLEHTQHELAKSHDSNHDLKTKLQTVVREKDPTQLPSALESTITTALSQQPLVSDTSQINAMKRQLKEAKDQVSRQKVEIDQLKSKLDMSVSKLTGTEKALSEALKDVKQEKDKFLKISTEYNRKVRNLESQLKEVTGKMEKYHENSLIKDKENRKLDLDLKQSQQKMRDHEREILKLKAVEQEYRQTKARVDETEKMVSRLRMDLKERDGQIKKMEIEYEEQFENMMQEVTKERDDIEQHVEELKNELVEAKRKTDMSEEVSSNVADILREKDEIIAQLEEKVIESETKLAEVNEEANANEEENTELHSNMELLQEEIDNSLAKISSLEKSLSQYQSQIQRFEKDNASLRKHMDDLRKENTELSERIEGDKTDVSHLVEDNASLKSTVKDLEQEVHNLHERLKEVVSGHDRLSMSSDGTSHDMLHTLIMVTAEMNDISDCMLNMRRQFDKILPNFKGDQKTKLTQIAEMMEDLGQKCDNISEILKDGGSGDVKGDKIEKVTVANVEASRESEAELEALKEKNKQIKLEADKWKAELSQMQSKFAKLQSEDNEKKEKMKMIDETYKSQINGMSKRVDEIASKNKIAVEKSEKPVKKKSKGAKGPVALSEKIQEQLSEIEDKVEKVEKVLQTHDISSSSADTENQTETEEESETETEDSDEYTDSEEETDTDTETQDDSGALDVSQSWLSKLKEMKHQLEVTNSKVKVLTGEMDIESLSKDSDITPEVELRQTLVKCGEKIDSLTGRLSDGLKTASTEMPVFSDSTWAFQTCIKKLKDKITEVNLMVNEHDDMNAKELKNLRGRVTYLTQFVEQVDMLGANDWEIAGKIAKQELKFKHLLSHKESATRQSTFRYEDRLQLYANKLAFEAMILGQMAVLVQRQQVGVTYKDALLREIHEANLQILELERRIDSTTRELSPLEQEKDLVSSYAAILAERIVLEGQLASNTMVQDFESSENMEVLADLNVDESPTVLAMEIFLRSQLDSSVSAQLAKLSESMDNVSNHIVTKALLQGEITHALQTMKRKFKKSDASEPLPALVKRERDFAYEQLRARHQVIIDLVNETEPLVMQTLIQLIEYTQGPSAPSLDSVCEKMTGIVQACIKQYVNLHDDADSEMKAKYTHIITHLHSEMEDAISIFREEYHCYVQTASPDINPNVLKFSADTVSEDLAGMFIQKAVIDGTFDHVSDLFMKSPDVSASQLMEPSEHEAEGLSDLAKNLGQILLTEAANKEKLALQVKNIDPSDKDALVRSIGDLVGVIPDLEAYPQTFDAYAATLVREAMFQSQLTYTTYKLKLQYHRDLRDIKLKMEAGEKVVLPSEVSREAESDIQASLTTFEEILNNKYQDEIAVLNLLESEISKLKSVSGEKSCSKCKAYDNCVRQLEKTFQNEISLTQERQHVHIDVLHQEVSNVILRVDKFLEDCEKEKESLISDYDERIVTLQEEFDLMRINHEEELEQSKQDIMTAVSAIKATEESTEMSNLDSLKNHNRQLVKMSAMCKELLMEIRNGDGSSGHGKELRDKIEVQLTNIESIEDDPNFTLFWPLSSKMDISLPSSPEHPSSPPLTQELPKLDRSLTAELSDENVDKLLERSQHEHEMEQLKKEKEAALADEIKVTKAALDAMRKAYEEELDQEKEKYRNALKTMFTDNYVEDIRRRQEIEMERMREELKQMSMHYESNSEDYKLLEDRLQRTKEEYSTHINQLSKSNEHLTQLLETEIQQLKEFIHTRSTGRLTGNATIEEELYDAQIMVRVKDAELQKLRLQVKNLENSLERTTEEQRYTMTQYLQCIKKNQELQAKLKEEVSNKERRDSTTTDEQLSKNARALRRNPSFHQRARSPSPETSPRKDSAEHHSRDSHRRSRGHLSAKDLKRSKSSPSLPYVFEAKGGAHNLALSQSRPSSTIAAGVTRRDSAKFSKSPKK